jgi:hypothetical protein
MLKLLQRLKPVEPDANIVNDIAKLASTEHEVRTLEMLIDYISSLENDDLAAVWPRLISAIYRPVLADHSQCSTSGEAEGDHFGP